MAAEAGKRDHATVWKTFHDGLAPAFRRAGYLPHPAFVPGFDPGTRSYEAVFLGRPAPDGLRLIFLGYAPHETSWHVIGQHYATRDAATLITQLAKRTSDWTETLSGLAARRNDLVPSAGWAFWRGSDRLIYFNERTGRPKELEAALKSALRALPEFLEDLGRPGSLLR